MWLQGVSAISKGRRNVYDSISMTQDDSIAIEYLARRKGVSFHSQRAKGGHVVILNREQQFDHYEKAVAFLTPGRKPAHGCETSRSAL